MNYSKLSFMQVDEYEYNCSYTCDFSQMPRPHYCMGLIIDGTGIFEFDGRSVMVNKGDIIFVPVGSTYISKWSGNPARYISIHFSFEYPGIFPQNTKPDIQKISTQHFDDIRKMCEKILHTKPKNNAEQLSALGNFYQIMALVYPEILLNKIKKMDSRILKAIEYIEQHYNENFSVKDITKLCALSGSHFHTLFKESVGCSPVEYKLATRIRRAELMLIENMQKTIEDISAEVGFDSSIYFRKVFKKITGKSPREYRRIRIE